MFKTAIKSTLVRTISAVSLLALSGCFFNQDASDEIRVLKTDMGPLLNKSAAPAPEKNIDVISFSDDYWIGGGSFVARRGDPIPSVTIGVRSHNPITLQDLAGIITDETRIATYVDTSGPDGESTDTAEPTDSTLYATEDSTMYAGTSSDSQSVSVIGGTAYPVNYEGPLQGLLDFATARWSVDAEFQEGRIRFYKYATRTFQFEVLPAESEMSTDMGMDTGSTNNSETSGSTSAIAQKVSTKFKMDGWAGIEDGLKSIIPDGSRYSLNTFTGTITVTAPNWAMRRVEEFINAQNKIMRRAVTLNIQIMTVTLDRANDFGLDLDAVFENSTNVGLALAAPSAATFENAGTLTADVLSGGLSGSQAVIKALSTRGEVAMVDDASITVMNNTVGPINMLRQTGYLSQSSSTPSGDSTTTTLEQATTTTGLSIALLPRIFEDGRVLLNASIQIAALRNLDTVSSGDSEIQTPDIDIRGFQQVASVTSGQAMVLTGLGRYSIRRDQSGMGSPELVLLGGADQAERNRTQIIITITPRVLADHNVRTSLQ